MCVVQFVLRWQIYQARYYIAQARNTIHEDLHVMELCIGFVVLRGLDCLPCVSKRLPKWVLNLRFVFRGLSPPPIIQPKVKLGFARTPNQKCRWFKFFSRVSRSNLFCHAYRFCVPSWITTSALLYSYTHTNTLLKYTACCVWKLNHLSHHPYKCFSNVNSSGTDFTDLKVP